MCGYTAHVIMTDDHYLFTSLLRYLGICFDKFSVAHSTACHVIGFDAVLMAVMNMLNTYTTCTSKTSTLLLIVSGFIAVGHVTFAT